MKENKSGWQFPKALERASRYRSLLHSERDQVFVALEAEKR